MLANGRLAMMSIIGMLFQENWQEVLGAIGLYYSETRRSAELANGRLAMMAIIGMFFQVGLAGSA